MKRNILMTIVALLTAWMGANAAIGGDWKLYASFDNYVDKVIDTPDVTYMLALGQPYKPAVKSLSSRYPFLYAYDKQSDEIRALTKRDVLSENLVSDVFYNAAKKYLLIIYSNGNIDIIDSKGYSHNIPGLKAASINGSKGVNDAVFDNENNRIYLATDFGYVAINDDKKEIAESRIFNKKMNSVGRVGNRLVLLTDEGSYSAPIADRNMSLSDFKAIDAINRAATTLRPLAGERAMLVLPNDDNRRLLYALTLDGNGEGTVEVLVSDTPNSITENRDGYILSSTYGIRLLDKNGKQKLVATYPDNLKDTKTGSWDGKEFWFGVPRKGLMSQKTDDGKTWTMTRESILPDVPATFMCSDMTYSPKYGLLTSIHRSDDFIFETQCQEPLLISGLKNGSWTEYAPAYTNPNRVRMMYECDGIQFDPFNSDYLWAGSAFNGFVRLNLTDPNDIKHFSGPKDSDYGKDGFYEVIGTCSSWDALNSFKTPRFDTAGNMFTIYCYNTKDPRYKGPLYVWEAADHKALNVDKLTSLSVKGLSAAKGSTLLPLKSSLNKNLLVMCGGNWDDDVIVYNHGGTPASASDDKQVNMSTLFDQDGSTVTKNRVYCLHEDLSTGYVWVGTFNGVFYFSPTQAMKNPGQVYRVKVSRNDGTNLADYLLDNIIVYCIAQDGKGRKWFGTAGGGIVVTSADGHEVFQEFNVDNSALPGNSVFSMAYNPENNSMMVSTDGGLCEFRFTGSSESNDVYDGVRVYPNPVRPDFLGWVTIDGLPDGSLVKIVDAAGNLVRELGRCDGGSVQWDICNYNLKRVQTGVYYVAMSTSNGDTANAKIAKILVVN